MEPGEIANITLFDPVGESSFSVSNMMSRSKNSPFSSQDLLGNVYGIVNGKNSVFA